MRDQQKRLLYRLIPYLDLSSTVATTLLKRSSKFLIGKYPICSLSITHNYASVIVDTCLLLLTNHFTTCFRGKLVVTIHFTIDHIHHDLVIIFIRKTKDQSHFSEISSPNAWREGYRRLLTKFVSPINVLTRLVLHCTTPLLL